MNMTTIYKCQGRCPMSAVANGQVSVDSREVTAVRDIIEKVYRFLSCRSSQGRDNTREIFMFYVQSLISRYFYGNDRETPDGSV